MVSMFIKPVNDDAQPPDDSAVTLYGNASYEGRKIWKKKKKKTHYGVEADHYSANPPEGVEWTRNEPGERHFHESYLHIK